LSCNLNISSIENGNHLLFWPEYFLAHTKYNTNFIWDICEKNRAAGA
jgi:hypothetical protein